MPVLYLAHGNGHKSSNRALWDDIKKEYFVNLLCLYIPHGPKRNPLSKETWVKITSEMRVKFPESSFSTEQLKQLERDLKKLFRSIKCIESESGFKWDDSDSMLKASNDDWQKLFERDPKAKKWHRKALPYYTKLNALYGGCHEAEVAQSKHETNASFHLTEGLGTTMLTDANEAVIESLTTNPNQCDNPETLLNLSISQNQDKESHFQELNLLPEEPRLTEANKQNELPLFINRECQKSCGLEIEPVMANPTYGNYNFSIYRCISEYHELLGFQESDLLYVAEIFKDEQNRELFLALRKSERAFWLRANIDVRRQAFLQNINVPISYG